MRVAVLGAGVAGVTTSYYLADQGCDLTLIDQASEPAAGTSHANGGQLSYSFTDSLAKPSFVAGIPGLLLGRDPAVRVRLASDPSLIAWGLRFLRECMPSRARANTVALLEMGMRSASLLADIVLRTEVQFAHERSGKLVLLPAGANLSAVRETKELKKRHGCETELLSFDEACGIEPSLATFTDEYAGAIYSRTDEVGDARAFTCGIGDWLVRERGIQMRLNEKALSLIVDGGAVRGVRTDRGDVAADAVVVCLGAWSGPLLALAGLRTHIYPVRGYSVTLPRLGESPSISITDLRRRLLFCPLDGHMRIAGFADFVGFDGRQDDARISQLADCAERVAPAAADYSKLPQTAWAGSRPMTPDGRPLLGATGTPGLYLNCGHGMLGWTLACASAEQVAAAVCAP
jgi:D-amino-acid dehydrogenase